MDPLRQDVLHGWRSLRKRPGLTLAAVLTLALGIGANAAIFAVVHAVLLRPFPFQRPEQLVAVWETQQQQGLARMYASPPNYADWKAQATAFASMGLTAPRGLFLEQDGEPLRVAGAEVTSSFLDALGAVPLAGRLLTAEDDRPDAAPVALLSHALWQGRFGADRGLVGRSLLLDGRPHTAVGVLPPGFGMPAGLPLQPGAAYEPAELWVPYASDPASGQRGAHYLTAVARLKPEVSIDQAEAEMNVLAGRLSEQHPDTNSGWGIRLVPLGQQLLGESRPALLVLFGAVGFVLLIACVNVAGLLLARGAERRKEFALRAALGAGQARIVRLVLVESLLLALLGAAAGLLLAHSGLGALIRLAPPSVPRLDQSAVGLPVVGFTLGLTLLGGLLAGLGPAWLALRQSLREALASGTRSAGAEGGSRLRRALVIGEVAVSATLLVGAALMLRTLLQLRGVDPGFRPENVLTAQVSLPQTHTERPQRAAAYEELERQLAALPGVAAAGFVFEVPLAADRQGTELQVEGRPAPQPGQERHTNFTFVTPGLFRALGLPLRQGRHFGEQDRPWAAPT